MARIYDGIEGRLRPGSLRTHAEVPVPYPVVRREPRPSPVQVHVLSFEGPDASANAGGLATRVNGLTAALAHAGFATHHWFIGDPDLPGHETRGRLTWHRWGQWISRYHPGGVYDGEEGKRLDLASSLPPFLLRDVLLPHLMMAGSRAVVLAEEWHTADAVLHLDWLLRRARVRNRVAIFWNANNTFGFDRIDWRRLSRAATITTVSRYMRYEMWRVGVDPLVIANGLPADVLDLPAQAAVDAVRSRVPDRLLLAKVGRFDPDKRWLLAIETVAELKRLGRRPLLVARGGIEPHGLEVRTRAAQLGVAVAERPAPPNPGAFPVCLNDSDTVDVVLLHSPVTPQARGVLFRAAAAVLANSGREPFGLVGLETMAAGGVACVGATGEDYAVPGWNALILQTSDPREFAELYCQLEARPSVERSLRLHGRTTARRYAWSAVLQRELLPRLAFAAEAAPVRPVPAGRTERPASPPRSARATARRVDSFVPALTARVVRQAPQA
jgi:glycosyltransferase involved in cell wall biosynthesis